MTNTVKTDIEGDGAANRDERQPRAAGSHRFAVSDETLTFHTFATNDPVLLGRQILTAAGREPPDDYSLFAILPSGDFEDVRLDETFDLRGKGVERFVAFKADRTFRLTLNGHEVKWGKPSIAGSALYALADVPAGDAVFLDTRGGQDRLIEPSDVVDLSGSGVERFVTGPRPELTYEIIVNARPKKVTGSTVTFDQVVQLAFPGNHDPNVEFSVTYNHAASTPPAGELGRGGSVQVKNGTRFNVTRTVQS